MSIEIKDRTKATSSDFANYESDYKTKKTLEDWVRQVVEDDDILLSKTGFNVAANVAQYIYLQKQGNLEGYKSLTEKDIFGHTLEFSLGDPVIKYEIEIGTDETGPVILTKDYLNDEFVPLLALLNPNERNGAVVKRTTLMAKLLSEATPGTFFVSTSPDGWHGLKSKNNVPYTEYNHSQTALYEVLDNGKIKAYTVRSSMNLDENEEFLRRISNSNYSPKENSLSNIERIINVVDTVVETHNIKNINELITNIQEIRRGNPFWNNYKYSGEFVKQWKLNEVLSHIKLINEDRYLKDDLSPVFNELWLKIDKNINGNSIDDVRLLSLFVRDAVLKSSFVARNRHSKTEAAFDVDREITHNEGQSGCVSVVSEFGSRTLAELGIDYPFDKKGRCRSRRLCLSGNEGNNKWLAACDFCLNCDIGIRTGKLHVNDILSTPDETDSNKLQKTTRNDSITSIMLLSFVNGAITLFSKN